MNLSGNPEHREAYVLSAEPAGPAPGTVSPAGARGRRAGGRAPVGIFEIHVQQLGDAADPVGHGIAVQAEPLRGLDDGALLVEVGRERPDRRVGPGLGGRRPEPCRPLRPGGRLSPTVVSASSGSKNLAVALQAHKSSLTSIDPVAPRSFRPVRCNVPGPACSLGSGRERTSAPAPLGGFGCLRWPGRLEPGREQLAEAAPCGRRRCVYPSRQQIVDGRDVGLGP